MDFTFGAVCIACAFFSGIFLALGASAVAESKNVGNTVVFIAGSLFGWMILSGFKALGL